MSLIRSFYYVVTFMLVILVNSTFASTPTRIPILCYHNFNPTVPGSMTLTPQKFEAQLKYLKDNGFHVIPLKEAVEYLEGKRESLPEKPIVITADDGWKSVHTYMLPLVKKYNIPITLFIYPQTISSGKNAMTWEDLIELKKTGLFDIQGHTYDHPNFKHEKKRRSAESYDKYVQYQLIHSKQILEDKLNQKIIFLAWPFGIYDRYLEDEAAKAGYEMSFTIDARKAKQSDRVMAVPRYMIVDGQTMKTFMAIVN